MFVYQTQGIAKHVHASAAPHNLQVQSYFLPHAWTSTHKSMRRSGDTRTHMSPITQCQLSQSMLVSDRYWPDTASFEFPHPSLWISRTSLSALIKLSHAPRAPHPVLVSAFEIRHSAQAELICAAWGA